MNEFGLIPISPLTLNPQYPLGVDVYAWGQADEKPVLFLAQHQEIASHSLDRICNAPQIKLFISRQDQSLYQQYLNGHLQQWLEDSSISDWHRTAVVSEVIRYTLEQEFAGNHTPSIVQSVDRLAGDLCKLMTSVTLSGRELCQILHHDFGTFTHSTNVGLYCGLLASELGYRNEELKQIISGGLLHDLGKLDVDPRIMNKPGKLDEFEMREMQTHPILGYRRLVSIADISDVALMMAYQHHERLDGEGYPVGIGHDEIEVASRICSIADVFEALTSQRPYRNAMSFASALAILNSGVDKAFDREILRCWQMVVRQHS